MSDLKQTVVIDIPVVWLAQLKSLAMSRGVTTSDLMIEALRQFLQTDGREIALASGQAIASTNPTWDDVEDEPDEILWSFLDDPNEG
jgi:hypothetical protein